MSPCSCDIPDIGRAAGSRAESARSGTVRDTTQKALLSVCNFWQRTPRLSRGVLCQKCLLPHLRQEAFWVFTKTVQCISSDNCV